MSSSPRSVLQAPEGGPSSLVLGGGIAGLLAAHVACKHFNRVTLVDADGLVASAQGDAEQAAKQRRGIPQYLQLHTLVTGGLQAIEAELPGFKAELLRRGGWDVDIGRDFQFFDFGAPFARAAESSLKSVGASRHLIQTTLQSEVFARNAGHLTVRGGSRVSGLLWSKDGGAVVGVELASGEQLRADAVIVALGRYSRLPQWLETGGYEAAPVQRVDCGFVYCSRQYEMPPGWAKEGPWLGHITYGRPHCLRGGGIVPIEGNAWTMGLFGLGGEVPPTDEEGFLRYAASLPDLSIYEAICSAKPLTPIHKHGGTQNLRHCYDRILLPRGLLVLGDAYVALNPIYAQGMSVAAMSAVALDQALAAALQPASGGSPEAQRAAIQGMGPAFQKRLAAVVDAPWSIATSEDIRYPGVKVRGVARPPRLLMMYLDALFRACHRDSRVQDVLFSVAHMTRPPHHLFHPHLLAAAAGQATRDVLQRWWPDGAASGARAKAA